MDEAGPSHQVMLATVQDNCWYRSVSIASRFRLFALRLMMARSRRSRSCRLQAARRVDPDRFLPARGVMDVFTLTGRLYS